jgi:phosphoenolpyruvate-protein phosphotransferase (PTS system enzyme I)
MERLQGIAVSPGVAIGEALIFDDEGFGIPRPLVARDGFDAQIERLDQAMDQVESEITHDRDEVSRELGDHYGAIFSAHLQMLRDPKLRQEVEQLMRDEGYSPEYAVSSTLRRYAHALQQLESHYLSERSHDVQPPPAGGARARRRG